MAHKLAFHIGNCFAHSFAVSHLGLAHIGLHIELALHAIHDDFKVQLAHTTDNGLAGFRIGVHTERRVLGRQALQGDAHLVLIALRLGFDAHFDNRIPETGVGASSGTGFWQIAQEGQIHSLHIGIQRNSNTLKLFDTAHHYGMKYILADELFFENLPSVYEKIDALADSVDVLYCTICMDVFNAAIAPGVSAVAYNGIFADATFMHFYRRILKNSKLVALDVAEVNPSLDIVDRTSKLAASLVNEWFMADAH